MPCAEGCADRVVQPGKVACAGVVQEGLCAQPLPFREERVVPNGQKRETLLVKGCAAGVFSNKSLVKGCELLLFRLFFFKVQYSTCHENIAYTTKTLH